MATSSKPKAVHTFKDVTSHTEINKFLTDIDPGGDLISGTDSTDIRGWCSTGNYMMNAHYSGSIMKGFPLGRAITIGGDPKTGKTYFALEMAEELQKLGYFVQYYETEASPDSERFIAAKLNPNMFRKTPVKHIEKAIHWIAATNDKLIKVLESGKPVPKLAYVIDSWNGLITEKDEADAIAGNLKSDMGHFARLGKKLMNIYSINGAKLDIPLIITCHVYEKDMKSFRMKVTSGGNGPLYFSSIIPMLSKKKVSSKETDDDGNETKTPTGIMITSKLLESRYAKASTCDIYLDFKKGINPFQGLLPFCSWDVCGIDKGSVINPTDFVSLLLSTRKTNEAEIVGFDCSMKNLEKMLSKSAYGNGNSVAGTLEHFKTLGYVNDKNQVTAKIKERFEGGKYKKFEDKITALGASYATYICKHLPGELFSAASIHQAKVFTHEVLLKLDDVIRPLYEYGDDGAPEISEAEDEEVDHFKMD